MKKNKLKISLYIIIFSILFFIGFTFGYLIGKPIYNENPMITGIKDINKQNKANFSCSCISSNPRMIIFVFDETGISTGNFYG